MAKAISQEETIPRKTIGEWREITANFGKETPLAKEVHYQDFKVPLKDGDFLSCRLFNDDLLTDSPLFIFYPGCAFIFDFFEVNSAIASRIALASRIKVILVQFRLAPEHPMPTSLQDSYEAFRYILSHAPLFRIDLEKVFIGGWCSGANAATFVAKAAHRAKEFTICHQILLSGSFDLSHTFHTFDPFEKEDTTLKRDLVAHLAQLFYSMDSDRNPFFSPYWDDEYEHIPPTTLLFGEYDALRNDSEAYFNKLQNHNIPVDKIVLKKQTHNQVVMPSSLPNSKDPAEVIGSILQRLSL